MPHENTISTLANKLSKIEGEKNNFYTGMLHMCAHWTRSPKTSQMLLKDKNGKAAASVLWWCASVDPDDNANK